MDGLLLSSLFVKNGGLLSTNILTVMNALNVQVELIEASAVQNGAMIITILPLVVLYAFLQKFFISGITNSGIVG